MFIFYLLYKYCHVGVWQVEMLWNFLSYIHVLKVQLCINLGKWKYFKSFFGYYFNVNYNTKCSMHWSVLNSSISQTQSSLFPLSPTVYLFPKDISYRGQTEKAESTKCSQIGGFVNCGLFKLWNLHSSLKKWEILIQSLSNHIER